MSDPHVEALFYAVKHSNRVDYTKAQALEHEEAGFVIKIENGKAKFTMKSHHPTLEAARAEVEPFIKAWELSSALSYEPGAFELTYDHANLIDRSPRPGHTTLYVEPDRIAITLGTPRICVGRANYPAPPTGMSRDPDVDLMYEIYCQYWRNQRTLADTAYFCLTVLERQFENQKPRRNHAAKHYRVDADVLSTLGELSSTKGGAGSRKAGGSSSPFSNTERDWLEAAIKRLIGRAAEIASSDTAPLQQITMADFPNL